MTTIEIPQHVRKEDIANYCSVNISPRSYYLHDSIGGVGWRLYTTKHIKKPYWQYQHSGWYLELDNEQYAILIRLKYGSPNT